MPDLDDLHLRHMDEAGIDMQILALTAPLGVDRVLYAMDYL